LYKKKMLTTLGQRSDLLLMVCVKI